MSQLVAALKRLAGTMSHLVANPDCRPFFAENCSLDSFPGATNPK